MEGAFNPNESCTNRVAPRARAKILFIIFVDRIFTTLFERLFTNVFDVISTNPAIACVYPRRTTD
jgi:hypothetical protein